MTRNYKFFTVESVDFGSYNRHRLVARKGFVLGTIEWYPPWRQFVRAPADTTVWSAGCLRDVLDAMEKIELERSDAALRQLIEEDMAKEAADGK